MNRSGIRVIAAMLLFISEQSIQRQSCVAYVAYIQPRSRGNTAARSREDHPQLTRS